MDTPSLYKLFEQSTGVTTDSRNIPEGSIFFALRGDSFNGNAYAGQALEKGSAYAVVDDKNYFHENNSSYILVEDSLKSLQQLAAYHRRKLKTPVIGITGTNGKTTTKELIAAVLQTSFSVLYTEGNMNNHIGVPLTLLRLTPEYNMAVIEMGANHPGEIAELAQIADPDYGIITNVGKAHLEGFGSFEGVIKTKGELYEYLRSKDNTVAFVDRDNDILTGMATNLNTVFYGTTPDTYINGRVTANSPFLELEWSPASTNLPQQIATQLIGEYNIKNVLAAITIGYYLGVPPESINRAIHDYEPQNNRSQLKITMNNTLIIDAYNANPTSMQAALVNFANMAADRKMVILGDMKELGADSEAEHQNVIDLLETLHFDEVVLIGENFSKLTHPYASYTGIDDYIDFIADNRPSGMTILIKGSNSTRLSKVGKYL